MHGPRKPGPYEKVELRISWYGPSNLVSDPMSCRVVVINAIQKMLRSVDVYIPNSAAERVGFIPSRVNKTPIRYETESNTLVIRYRVNGAQIVSTDLPLS